MPKSPSQSSTHVAHILVLFGCIHVRLPSLYPEEQPSLPPSTHFTLKPRSSQLAALTIYLFGT